MTVLPPDVRLDPAAYPHGPAAVELRETHISWVFLAGERVYKEPHERADADAESRAVYRELGRRATAAVARDGGVILDATFRRPEDVAAFAAACPVTPEWLVCEAPPQVLLERATTRERAGGSISDAGREVVAAELAAHGGRFDPPGAALARLDTTRPVGELLEGLAAALDARLERGATAGPPA